MRQGRMVPGDKGQDVFYPGSGPLDGGNTLLLLDCDGTEELSMKSPMSVSKPADLG